MTIALADTSLFVALETGRPLAQERPTALAVSVVTLGELRFGVLAATPETMAARLNTLVWAESFEPLEIDAAVASAWAELRADLRRIGRRMPVNDSWLAATAIAHDIPIATQDADYDDVPHLRVVKL